MPSGWVDAVVKLGILPAIIIGQGYMLYLLVTDGHKVQEKSALALQSLTDALGNLTEYVRGGGGHG